ncbi:periplasmic sensor signal transduction histidine kinase [Aquipluma nitroreducens]|uniref:histidine kinase n=1 Tax=Aquipluma nitroreducens TaxID=2010828 RepID=A0A5K7S2K1_9BACT|nr:HAMP domain-containing sensor histidine kinase [Aquipluma nitroreducens]BBE15892.1 periplasmic sensor signal transduction histidine kinase [Aquipluma nitroreducens]
MQLLKLEKENEELVRSLSEVNEKLHDSERLKGHFISNITNEIVNPFTSVIALAENIKRLKEGEIPMAHHMAELIFEEAFHLDFQLKNIFAAALIEAGKEQVKCSVINLNDLNHQISEYFRQLLDKKRIQLSIHFSNESTENDQILFTSDREKLDLILKNLISNSIKYSPEDSVVELKYFMGKKELHFEVYDQGKGINPDDRKIIFDRFKQLDEKINSINTGHGLGLSIVQAYAEMLGGKVRLNDNFDKGVNVMVIIPESAEASDWDDLEDFLLDSEASY